MPEAEEPSYESVAVDLTRNQVSLHQDSVNEEEGTSETGLIKT